MRPERVELRGFGRYATPTTLDLDGVRCAAIVGENGAGKSTLLDAVTWTLWGESRWGVDKDAPLSPGCDVGSVELTFSVAGQRWRVHRSRVRGKKTTLVLAKESAAGVFDVVADSKLTETQAAIDAVVGMSGELATSTVLVTQGDADRFSAARPGQRKEVLGEIIGISRYGVWARRASKRANAVREELRLVDGRLGALRDQYGDHDATVAELAELEAAVPIVGEEVERLRAESAEAAAAASGAQEAVSRLSRLETIVTETEQRVAASRRRADRAVAEASERVRRGEASVGRLRAAVADPVAPEAVEAARQEVERLRHGRETAAEAERSARSLLERAEAALGRAEAARAEAAARIEALGGDGATCYTCGQHLAPEALERLSGGALAALAAAETEAEVESLAAKECRIDVEKAQAQMAELGSALPTAAARFETLSTQASAQRAAVEQLSITEAQLEGDRQALASAQSDQADALGDDGGLARLRAELAEVRATAGSAEELLARSQEAQQRLAGVERRLTEVTERAGRVRARAESEEAAIRSAGELEQQRVTLSEKVGRYELLAEAFGPKGIPALIFEGVVAELSVDASEVLSALSGGRMTLQLVSRRERKAGHEAETLEIEVYDAHGARLYHEFSGGERFRIDLALRIGLSKLLTRRAGGSPLAVICVDEGFGSLDSEGVGAAIECLEGLTKQFDLVLAMTHTPAVAEAFPTEIRVRRDTDPAIEVVHKAA